MIDNLYLTFLVGNGRLNENNDVDSTSFSSDVRTAGLDLQYNFSQISKIKPFLSLGAEFLNFKTDKQAIKSTIAIPLGIGVMLNVSERIEFDNRKGKEKKISFLSNNFASKEAVSKALDTGFSSGITLKNIEILRKDSGSPYLNLKGKTKNVKIQN